MYYPFYKEVIIKSFALSIHKFFSLVYSLRKQNYLVFCKKLMKKVLVVNIFFK